MASDGIFTEEEMAVDEGLGYPKAYAKLWRDRSFGPFSHGPPFTFTPYTWVQNEVSRAKELDEMFPIIDPKAKPTTKPKIFLNLLWKQLNHLGNAGFDPEIIRVDSYGNVLYYHADAASPLAWDIDHWFPCSNTIVLSNYIEEIVVSAISYHLMNTKEPDYRNRKLIISSKSVSHGLSIFQEGKSVVMNTLKVEAQAEKPKATRAERKAETAVPESKNDDPPAPKLPLLCSMQLQFTFWYLYVICGLSPKSATI